MPHAVFCAVHRPAPRFPSTGAAFRLWLPFLLLCTLLTLTAAAPVLAESLRVAKTLDGDTLRLTDGSTLRLAGIDTPERGHGSQPDQLYARESTELARTLTRNADITLRPVSNSGGTPGRDKYARLLGEVLLPDGSSLNERMIREGAAWVYWHRGLNGNFVQRLLTAQREAIHAGRGMWRDLLAHDAARKSYMGNSKSRRFFPVDSAEAQRISRGNRTPFSSLSAAFEAGYAPGRTRRPDAPHLPPRCQFLP